jgi:hypothetical protein
VTTPKLTPLNSDWVSPSLLWREAALCRDEDGALWVCRLDEAEGWVKVKPAATVDVRAFQSSQKLAGKEPQPWPDPPAPPPPAE